MSDITDFRDAVVASIASNVTELQDVDWYDGLFDEVDIGEWILSVPCCFVAVRQIKTSHHSTGEMNCSLDMIAVVITQDGTVDRDADGQLWTILEKIAVLANMNAFQDVNAAPGTNVTFERLRHPDLRREGVALGIVEWTAGLTIGQKAYLSQLFYQDPQGALITQWPTTFSTTTLATNKDGSLSSTETLTLTPATDE